MRPIGATWAVLGCALVATSSASAQPRLGLHLEGAAGVFVPDAPASRADLGPTVDVAARLGARLAEGLSAQLSGGYRRYLSSTQSDASAATVTAGLRGQLRAGRVGRAFVDAHAGAALSIDAADARFTFGAGLGFEFALGARVALGPVVRYAHTVAWGGGDDARALTAGLSLGFDLVPERSVAPPHPDTDGDGIVDEDDLCVPVPLGDTPDPAHLGCPADEAPVESDHDTVVAPPDRDHDGVPDTEDHCPDQPATFSNGSMNHGCPASVPIGMESHAATPRATFAAGSDGLSTAAASVLRDVATALSVNDLRVRVVGHVDTRTPAVVARRLARRRAARVCGALVDAGVAAARLTSAAPGVAEPLSLGAANDRVSFELSSPPDPPSAPSPTPSPASPPRPPVQRANCPPLAVDPHDPVRDAFDASAPPDRDHDGVADEADHCRADPMGDHPDRRCTGCPLRDRDGDGVLQDADRCPDEAAGAHPDPEAPGCPDRDADGDGALDHDDACPTVSQGAHPDPTRRGCPDGDRDADGVFDHADACPTAPPGPRPDPSRPGCALPDVDHDAVPDRDDRCVDRAGAPDTDAAHRGCPDALTYDATTGALRLARPVTFAASSESATSAATSSLDAIARAVRALGASARLRIEVPASNVDLATRRAAWLTEWLVAHGLGEAQVLAYPHGQGDAIASCAVVESAR